MECDGYCTSKKRTHEGEGGVILPFFFIRGEVMYRLEIDALNALIREQQRTNELLEKLLQRPVEDKPKRPYTRRVKNGSALKQA